MAKASHRCLVISDFNAANLVGLLGNDSSPPLVEAIAAPFGQVTELLLDPQHECWKMQPDSVLVWTQPQAVIESFARLLNFEDVDPEQILLEVDQHCERLRAAAARGRQVFVPSWVLPPQNRGLGMIDLTHAAGAAGTLLRMNARLIQILAGENGIFVLDAQRWITTVGKNAFSPRLWFMAKVPFANAVFTEAVADVKAAFASIAGKSRKLLVVDLDDTLWGGVVGDIGWENLRVGGHDPIGEAFAEFQRALKGLKNRGIVLGIVSKNEESVALDAIARHPDMVLRRDDFAGWRINWTDKARNLVELVEELNLGLQSVVFIDDNPAERDRIRQALPEVLVPDWPTDKMFYSQALAQLRCFDATTISGEDRTRSDMYVVDRERRDLARSLGSIEDWLKTLQIIVSAEPLTQGNLPRVAQLFNKTNQLNLSTRRLTAEQLWAWANKAGQRLWTLRLSDKFGDTGLIGIVSLRQQGDTGEILDFILSCRVFGRCVEETMVRIAAQHARELGLKTLYARYLATEKNRPTLAFLERSGLQQSSPGCFVWDLAAEYPAPAFVTLELTDSSRAAA